MITSTDRNENQKSQNQRGTPHSSDGGVLGRIIGFFMRDGSLSGLAREMAKDVQNTFHEAAYGHAGPGQEPGAPLTPLHSDIESAREFYSPRQDLPSPSDIIHGRNFTAAEQGQSYMRGQEQGNFQTAQFDGPSPSPAGNLQRELERRGQAGDPNGLLRGRVLPDEQMENNKGRDR